MRVQLLDLRLAGGSGCARSTMAEEMTPRMPGCSTGGHLRRRQPLKPEQDGLNVGKARQQIRPGKLEVKTESEVDKEEARNG